MHIEDDSKYKLPADHPEQIKVDKLNEWLDEGGAERSKLKLRFHSQTDRRMHAV